MKNDEIKALLEEMLELGKIRVVIDTSHRGVKVPPSFMNVGPTVFILAWQYPGIDLQINTRKRCDGIHNRQHTRRLSEPTQLLRIAAHTGRGLSVHKGDELGLRVGLNRLRQFFRVNRVAPTILHHHRLGATSFDVLFHAPAKNAILTDNGGVTRLKQIHKGRLHAR